MVVFGQALRSIAMIHASTNFSHSLAFRKLARHQLVTDGIYAFVLCRSLRKGLSLIPCSDGSAIHRTLGFSIGRWGRSSCSRILLHSWPFQPYYGGFSLKEYEVSSFLWIIIIWNSKQGSFPVEEKTLINFFGDAYVEYRKRVGTTIPFIS